MSFLTVLENNVIKWFCSETCTCVEVNDVAATEIRSGAYGKQIVLNVSNNFLYKCKLPWVKCICNARYHIQRACSNSISVLFGWIQPHQTKCTNIN